MESFLLDLRYAIRSLRRSPGFTLVATLTLALGIGANTAMFSVTRSVLFAHLPFANPERIINVTQRLADGNQNIFSTPDFLESRQDSPLLAHMGAFVPHTANLAASGETPERLAGGDVSADMFTVLGVQPEIGRIFTAAEDQPNGPAVAVLSHALWQTRFHSDPAIVLLVAIGLSIGVGVLFGIVPAFSASRVDLNRDLHEGSRGTGRLGRHRSALLIAETALACVLLIGAGLAMKTLWKLANVPLGFAPSHLLTFRVSAASGASNSGIDFYNRVLERVKSLPDVEAAALARDLPMSGTDPSMPIAVLGGSQPADTAVARYRAIAPGYFRTMGIDLRRGRDISDADTAISPPVVIVSQSLAREYWPNQDPIGQRIQPKLPGAKPTMVIGIAADVRHWSRDTDIEPTAYYPFTQAPAPVRPLVLRYMTIAVRSRLAPEALLPSVRAAVADVDKTTPIYNVTTMDSSVADSSSLRRFDMSLLATFAGLALALAAIGVYGVMAYSVSQRTREIGIRVALGASRGDILRLIVTHAGRLGAIGVAVGLLAAIALARVMATVVYGVSPRDLATFSIAAGFVMAVILLAGYLPARRATRVDPLVALRAE
ncbi:MAG: ABC transporter permease [Terriglobales bacterium]